MFDDFSLYEFASSVVKRLRPRSSRERESGIWQGQFISEQHPQHMTHYQTSRRTRRVPVLLGPSIPRSDRSEAEREQWAQTVVVLFKPWRVPNDLKSPDESWLETVLALRAGLAPWLNTAIRNMNVLSECRDAR
ncbi:hypothetical protein B0H16DRAFT_1298298, partial [Mycena metata]